MAAIGNQIDAAFVFARSELVNVCDPEKTQTMKKPMTRSRAAKKKALAITRAKPNNALLSEHHCSARSLFSLGPKKGHCQTLADFVEFVLTSVLSLQF